MRKMKPEGPAPLGTLAEPPALLVDEFERLAKEGASILDCRSPEAFAAHIPGAVNVGLGSSFPTWAGTALPGDASIILLIENERDLWEVSWQLLRIGYDLPKGWLAGGMMAWRTAAKRIELLPQSTVQELQGRLRGVQSCWLWMCASRASGTRGTSMARCTSAAASFRLASTKCPETVR